MLEMIFCGVVVVFCGYLTYRLAKLEKFVFNRFTALSRKVVECEDDMKTLTEIVKSLHDEMGQIVEPSIKELKRAVDDLPLDQIQAVYDAEKEFQEGLNSILNYYGPRQGEHDK